MVLRELRAVKLLILAFVAVAALTIALGSGRVWATNEGYPNANVSWTETTQPDGSIVATGVASTATDEQTGETFSFSEPLAVTYTMYLMEQPPSGAGSEGHEFSPDYVQIEPLDCGFGQAAAAFFVVSGGSVGDITIIVEHSSGRLFDVSRAFTCGVTWYCYGRLAVNTGHSYDFAPWTAVLAGWPGWGYIHSAFCY